MAEREELSEPRDNRSDSPKKPQQARHQPAQVSEARMGQNLTSANIENMVPEQKAGMEHQNVCCSFLCASIKQIIDGGPSNVWGEERRLPKFDRAYLRYPEDKTGGVDT
jgi:hypothetical protein